MSIRLTLRLAFATGLCVLGLAPVVRAQTAQDNADFRAAGILLEQGKLQEAETMLLRLNARLPRSEDILPVLTEVRLMRGDYAKAIEGANQIIMYLQNAAPGFKLRAQARYQQGEYAKGLEDAEQAAGLTGGAPDDQLLLLRGQFNQKLGRPDAAVDYYSQVLERDPQNVRALFGRGDIALDRGDAEAAQRDLSLVVGMLPNETRAVERLGQAAFILTDVKAAGEAFDHAIQLGTKEGRTWRLSGLTMFALGDYAAALGRFREAIAIQPERSDYMHLMVHLAQRRLGQPAGDLKPALAGMKQDWPRQIGQFLLGETREPDLLQTAFTQANPADQKSFMCDAYYYIGQARLLAGDGIAAKTFFVQALKVENKGDESSLAAGELRRL